METVGSRIKSRRRLLKLTQKDLAEWIGISASAVTQWENDVTNPSGENLLRLASHLQCDPQWILSGVGQPEPGEIRSGKVVRPVPIISWVQAGAWTECGGVQQENLTSHEFIDTTIPLTKNAFALRVKGESMTSAGPLSIPEDSIVIVEPEYGFIEDVNNKIVIARLSGSNEATIKKFYIDGPNKYLIPLNSMFRPIEVNGNCQIVGVVKQVVIDLQ